MRLEEELNRVCLAFVTLARVIAECDLTLRYMQMTACFGGLTSNTALFRPLWSSYRVLNRLNNQELCRLTCGRAHLHRSQRTDWVARQSYIVLRNRSARDQSCELRLVVLTLNRPTSRTCKLTCSFVCLRCVAFVSSFGPLATITADYVSRTEMSNGRIETILRLLIFELFSKISSQCSNVWTALPLKVKAVFICKLYFWRNFWTDLVTLKRRLKRSQHCARGVCSTEFLLASYW